MFNEQLCQEHFKNKITNKYASFFQWFFFSFFFVMSAYKIKYFIINIKEKKIALHVH